MGRKSTSRPLTSPSLQASFLHNNRKRSLMRRMRSTSFRPQLEKTISWFFSTSTCSTTSSCPFPKLSSHWNRRKSSPLSKTSSASSSKSSRKTPTALWEAASETVISFTYIHMTLPYVWYNNNFQIWIARHEDQEQAAEQHEPIEAAACAPKALVQHWLRRQGKVQALLKRNDPEKSSPAVQAPPTGHRVTAVAQEKTGNGNHRRRHQKSVLNCTHLQKNRPQSQ